MILVTAANGKTGRHVIGALRARGVVVRALARSEAVHEQRSEGVETIAGDMLDATVLRDALQGVRAVVHIGPAFHPFETAMGQAVVDGARVAGVRRLVQFSVSHPQLDFLANHQAKLRVEDYVVNSGLDYTILQPMHYMQNFDPLQIADEGVFRLPYSLTMPLSFVDLVDVAEVAARTVIEDGHIYATYPLCGTDLLTGMEIAAQVAKRSGVAVRGEEIPVGEFIAAISGGHPLPRYTVDALHRLFTYYGLHGITGNANVLRWLLGREPGSFAEFVDRGLNSASGPRLDAS